MAKLVKAYDIKISSRNGKVLRETCVEWSTYPEAMRVASQLIEAARATSRSGEDYPYRYEIVAE